MLNVYNNNNFIYSPALDMLLCWGRTRLFCPEDTDSLHEIESMWSSLSNETDPKKSLDEGFEHLNNKTEAALNFLHSRDALELYEENAVKAQSAIQVLDHVVMLSEAAEHFPEQNCFPNDFINKINTLFRNITIECEPSGLRLIPLNQWRQEVASYIPEEIRYLFPWYFEWTEFPPNTIDMLTEQWHNIESGHTEGLGIDTDALRAVLAAMAADRELLNHIRREAQFSSLLYRAVEKSFALRLLSIGDDESVKRSVSDEVEKKGFIASACNIIDTIKRLSSKEDRIERIFVSAFCGPDLSDKRRIELLNRVENELDSINFSSLNDKSSLKRLYQWHKGNLSDHELAAGIFDKWLADMDSEAKKLKNPVPDEAVSFDDAVQRLLTGAIYSKPGLIERIKSSFSFQLSISGKSVARALSKGAKKDFHLKADKNVFELSLSIKNDKVIIPGNYSELKEIRSSLGTWEEYYWNGWLTSHDDQEKIIFPAPEKGKNTLANFVKLEKGKTYKSLIVCIAPTKELITEAVSKAGSGEPISEQEGQQIIWLIYR